jgi:hypothetical protein
VSAIDPDRYPTAAAYVAALPSGLASYVDCTAKASLYRTVFDGRPIDTTEGLPAEIVDLVEHPRPVNTWIPEVHSHALMLAVFDRGFASVDEFAQFAYDTQHKLFASKIYAVLMRWTSPKRMLATASQRWELFHRGTTLRIDDAGESWARLSLRTPPHLYDHVSRRGLTEGFRAALEMSSRFRCEIELVEDSPTVAQWRAAWTPR